MDDDTTNIDGIAAEPARDSAALRRWMVALELLLAAEDALKRGGMADPTVAVILADTASETILGLIASLEGDERRGNGFDALLGSAFSALRRQGVALPGYLGADLQSSHKQRNAAIHYGAEQTVPAAEGAVSAARRLLGLLPSISAAFPDLEPGSGVVGAVAALTASVPSIATPLALAERRLRDGDHEAAADQGAIALVVALSRARPHLRPQRAPFGHVGQLNREAEWLRDTVRRTSSWMVPLALGLAPANYERMNEILGEATRVLNGDYLISAHARAAADVRWALDQVALVVHRLWAAGSIGTAEPRDWSPRTERREVRHRRYSSRGEAAESEEVVDLATEDRPK